VCGRVSQAGRDEVIATMRPAPTPSVGSDQESIDAAFRREVRGCGGRAGSAGSRIHRGKRWWPAGVSPVLKARPVVRPKPLHGFGILFASHSLRLLRCNVSVFEPTDCTFRELMPTKGVSRGL
jgi:hypothetical protein